MADELELTGSLHESVGQEQPEKTKTPEEERDVTDLEEILDNYTLWCSVNDAQMRQEDEDLEFEGGDQWDPIIRTDRQGGTDDAGHKIAAKPTLSINLCESRVLQVVNEARQARLGLSVQPKAGLANTKIAGYYKGLIRSIQADSGASEVRIWALERTSICGQGAYRINVEFNNDGDFDLDVTIERILNQGAVGWDVYSVMADRRDAGWCFAGKEWLSEKERLRRWPDKPIIPTDGAFEKSDHPWFMLDANKNKACLVVTYYKVVYEEQMTVYHPQRGTMGPMALTEFPPELQQAITSKAPGVRTRKVQKRSVLQLIADGSQILERDTWLGRYIPVIPTIGKEKNIKGKRSWKGIVTNLKDLNRGYNVTISSAVEAAGKIPRSEYIMAAGQDEGFEDMWDDSPIKAYTRLYYNPVSLEGKPVPPPQRADQEPAIQATLLLARVLKDDIGSVGGTVDPSFRAVNPYDRSGKAIEALQRQGAAGTSNFLDNLATISMVQEGRVLIDLIPKVYDKEGRVIGVMGEENDDETMIMIKRPFVRDPEGNPIPVPCPQCKGTGEIRTMWLRTAACPGCKGTTFATADNMPKEFNGKPVEYIDLSKGEFKVVPSIGRNFQTKQEEAMAAMTQLATSAPDLVPVYADLWVRAMGFSGSEQIADRIERTNPHAKKDDGTEDVPPEFAAKFQALQAEHQAALEQLKQAQTIIETDTVKSAAQKELLAMKLEAAEGLEHLKGQLKLMQQTAQGETTKEVEGLKGQIAKMLQEMEQQHEILLELLQAKLLAEGQTRERAADREDTREGRHAERQASHEERAFDRQDSHTEREADRIDDREARAAEQEAAAIERREERTAESKD